MKLWKIALYLILGFISIPSQAVQTEKTNGATYCTPESPCWPKESEWNDLKNKVNGHLFKGVSPLAPCIKNSKSIACHKILEDVKNPFYLESHSGSTQSNGWIDAWQAKTSSYVVAAENAQEIANAVAFAKKHHLKLVIKGTGHDYLGRSNAPDSLLVWTHKMRKVHVHNDFIPAGCPKTQQGIPAVTAEAGTRWLEAYKEVVVKNGRYVQGGGCTSVGVAGGFIQGGGFGSFSKKFGTGAAGILEAEIVTADGTLLTANACQNSDLYWALKGGGGGTFGIVTHITLETHALPALFGALTGTISASSDEDYKQLIDYFIRFYRVKLHNEHWGEQVILNPDNKMQLGLVFQGMNKTEVDRLWQPFKDWLSLKPEHYQFTLHSLVLPARKFWDYDYLSKNLPSYIVIDKRKNAPYGEFWWTGNQSEVSIYLTHYQSGYLPFRLFEERNASQLSDALFKASRMTSLSLHFNKGLSGASAQAVARQKNTSMNSAVLDAAALITIAGGQQYTYPDISGHKPNLAQARESALKAKQAMELIHRLSPDAGTYGNEADYFLNDWQKALWGSNYEQLLQIKRHYDPNNLFNCHHCIGSH
ncbi:FAD-dependent oxidoreductase [Legionella quateirensis]|uniref:FAD linked oxidase n=1 Tax=Legionella quateirensis TaxID=45072 RepID=A0A378KX80_9GAMM|nr:FAD-binding protein [Legionella quateirensis]KTD50787.1 FAD linked oxidase [Legionella quateirensis]STY17968.1 FAD linked oxidase [Legionella quateirensis]